MEPLSWTGAVGTFLNPILGIAATVLLVSVVLQIILSFFAEEMTLQANPDGTLMRRGGWLGGIERVTKTFFFLTLATVILYVVLGVFTPYGTAGIIGNMAYASAFTS